MLVPLVPFLPCETGLRPPTGGSACCWSDRFTSLSAKEVSSYHCPSNDGCAHLLLIPVMALTLYHALSFSACESFILVESNLLVPMLEAVHGR